MDVLLDRLVTNAGIPAVSVAVGCKGDILYSGARGYVTESRAPVTTESRFDVASLTKLVTGLCFMCLVDDGIFDLEGTICDIFPELAVPRPIIKDGLQVGWASLRDVTWRDALRHTTGIGWTKPHTRPSLPHLDKGLTDIFTLPLACQPRERIIYSDIPIILMGVAMQRVMERKLDDLVAVMVCEKLGLQHTGYLRVSASSPQYRMDIIPTEFDNVFRSRRIWGEVHDENAYLLDGVAAHSGIFTTAEDLCHIMMAYAVCCAQDGILRKPTMCEMVSTQWETDGMRRGLIFELQSAPHVHYTAGLSAAAYGHTGFTGCFAWNDGDMSCVFLSNDVYRGRKRRCLPAFRRDILDAAVRITNARSCYQWQSVRVYQRSCLRPSRATRVQFSYHRTKSRAAGFPTPFEATCKTGALCLIRKLKVTLSLMNLPSVPRGCLRKEHKKQSQTQQRINVHTNRYRASPYTRPDYMPQTHAALSQPVSLRVHTASKRRYLFVKPASPDKGSNRADCFFS